MFVALTGPHGAGKDTLRNALLQSDRSVKSIVRHTTRAPSPGEIDSRDYHFISSPDFAWMVRDGQFAEHAGYPEASTGTAWREIESGVENAALSITTMNLEDALKLDGVLRARGIRTMLIFVSPVSIQSFRAGEDEYIAALTARMESRNRPTDAISMRIEKARLYRELCLRTDGVEYLHNVEGNVDAACQALLRLTRDK